jgi:putative hydrolase
VSDPVPFSAGGPFGDLLKNLAQLLTSQGPVNWEVARQLAVWTASEGKSEPNPDPLARMDLEELLRVGEAHVAEATGLPTSQRGWLGLRCVTRSEWALATLESWKPLFNRLASSLAPPAGAAGEGGDPMAQLLGNLPQVLGPLLLGAQAGGMVGHLASRATGQYDMPMPAPPGDVLLSVPAVVDEFAEEWALASRDVRMYVCLRDVAYHAVLGRPHVDKAVGDYLIAYAGAFHIDLGSLEDRLGALDPSDLTSFQQSLGDPQALLGEMQSDEQRRLLVPFSALLAALSGYCDYVVDKVGQRLVGSYSLVSEAFRRRRVEDGPGQRVLGRLLGVEVDQATVERGHAFIAGVFERAGEDGLRRLWQAPEDMPTPAEVDAPGLWLARIGLLD